MNKRERQAVLKVIENTRSNREAIEIILNSGSQSLELHRAEAQLAFIEKTLMKSLLTVVDTEYLGEPSGVQVLKTR